MNTSRRVLVADDDKSIRETVALVLADEGYEVRTAPDGAIALSLLDQWPPDVILLDMKMPVMDGWAFADAYRRRSAPQAPVVVLTAAADADQWARQIGADGVLPKPFDLDALILAVEEHAAERVN